VRLPEFARADRMGKRQAGALLRSLGFERGPAPGYGTLQRVVSGLKGAATEAARYGWAQAALQAQGTCAAGAALAVDGKVLRGSRQTPLPGVHLLRVVAQDLGITVAQGSVGPTTNEAKAVLPLLTGLNLTNRISTGDAALMQREVCQRMIKQHGHYRMVLKANPPDLPPTVHDWFAPFPPPAEFLLQTSPRTDLGHGWIERRCLWVLPVYDDFLN